MTNKIARLLNDQIDNVYKLANSNITGLETALTLIGQMCGSMDGILSIIEESIKDTNMRINMGVKRDHALINLVEGLMNAVHDDLSVDHQIKINELHNNLIELLVKQVAERKEYAEQVENMYKQKSIMKEIKEILNKEQT